MSMVLPSASSLALPPAARFISSAMNFGQLSLGACMLG